jgi:hypothetical protein
VALSILFLDRLADQKKLPKAEKENYQKLIQHFALQLIAGQHESGGWHYVCWTMQPSEEQQLLGLLKNRQFVPGKFRPADPLKIPSYRDNSIGQFVLLALWNARKHKVPVGPTLLLEEKIYRQEQVRKDGSWYYNQKVHSSRDATTCAGLIGLAVGWAIRDEVNDPPAGKQGTTKPTKNKKQVDITKDPAIEKALKFIGQAIGKKDFLPPLDPTKGDHAGKTFASSKEMDAVIRKYYLSQDPNEKKTLLDELRKLRQNQTDKMDALAKQLYEATTDEAKEAINVEIRKLDNDDLATGILFNSDAWGDLYFLWSVERVSVIYGLERFDGKDWYVWGKDVILKNQREDGSWKERFPGVPDTCFALLFLRRANIVKDLTDKLQRLSAALGIGGGPEHNPPPDVPLPPREDA